SLEPGGRGAQEKVPQARWRDDRRHVGAVRRVDDFVARAAEPEQSASGQPMTLTVALSGDRAMAENVILEVRALAQKLILEISDVAVIGKPAIAPKKAI